MVNRLIIIFHDQQGAQGVCQAPGVGMAPGHAVGHADGPVQPPIWQVWVEPEMMWTFGKENCFKRCREPLVLDGFEWLWMVLDSGLGR